MNKQELIADLMWRSEACAKLLAEYPTSIEALRLDAKAKTYLHAAELARQLDDGPNISQRIADAALLVRSKPSVANRYDEAAQALALFVLAMAGQSKTVDHPPSGR